MVAQRGRKHGIGRSNVRTPWLSGRKWKVEKQIIGRDAHFLWALDGKRTFEISRGMVAQQRSKVAASLCQWDAGLFFDASLWDEGSGNPGDNCMGWVPILSGHPVAKLISRSLVVWWHSSAPKWLPACANGMLGYFSTPLFGMKGVETQKTIAWFGCPF